MPEKHRTTREYRLRQLAERDARDREAEQDGLVIVQQFNARLSAKRAAGFWPIIQALPPMLL